MPYYYLEITRGTEAGRRYALMDGAVSIGRSSSNTVAFHSSEKSVSGHHAIIYKTSSRIMIQDLQSTNGTYVNEEKVSEKDLKSGDIMGFGFMGPRVKLVESEQQLPVDTAPSLVRESENRGGTASRTADDHNALKTRPGTLSGRMTIPDIPSFSEDIPPTEKVGCVPSMTMELEQRIVEKRAGADDMRKLLKNGKRVARIVERGNIGETQAGLIVGAYQANKKIRKNSYLVLAGVVIVALSLIIFFAGRAMQYKGMLNKGQALETRLDQYDRLIAEAKADPEGNKERLAELIEELEKAGMELAEVKSELREGDAQTFYDDPVEKKIAGILSRLGEKNYHVPAEMVERVRYHIKTYSGPLKPTIGRYMKRREIYYPMIRSVFTEQKLPLELSYVAMLESGYNPNALSHVGARGMWQFMPATGRRYGLRVDDIGDDRVEPEKATRAAAEYFKDLVGIFGGQSSLMLAMAAYNAGEGRIQGALRKIDDPMRNRDFWYIYRMGYLAEETNEYIPRIFALMIISENRSEYGFTQVDSYAESPEALVAENDFVEFSLGGKYGGE
jgi:hypothetical protein